MKVADKIFLEVTPCPIEHVRPYEVGDLIIKLHWDYDTLYWRFQILKVKEIDDRGRMSKGISTPVITLNKPATNGSLYDWSKYPSFLGEDRFYKLVKEFDDANKL